MTETILCAVDRSPAAWAPVRVASALAERLALAVEYVHVLPDDEDIDIRRARRVHEALCGALDGRRVRLRLEVGPVAERLAALAREAALLVIGTRQRGQRRRAALGGVSDALVRQPPVPVVVVPTAAARHAIALSGEGVVCAIKDCRDATVADAAARLATGLGTRLTLVHALPPVRVPISAVGGAPPVILPGPDEDDARMARSMLETIAGSAQVDRGVATARLRVVRGPAGPELRRVADAEDALLMAVGPTGGGGGFGGLAEAEVRHVVRRARHPVMVCPRAG